MTSRHRQSSSRATPNRPSHAANADSSRSEGPASRLPPYQKLSHPLTRRAQHQLETVYSKQALTALQRHNKQAQTFITDAAGTINDQLREREEHVERRRKKWERGIHKEEQMEEERQLEELKATVEGMTKKLEESMRQVIDGEEAAQRTEESINWLKGQAPIVMQQEYATQQTQRESQQQSQTQSQRKRRRNLGEVDDEAGEEDEESSPGPTPIDGERVALTGPSEMLADRVQRKEVEYLNFSHGARYSKNNAYIGFKKMVHDAKYGDNGPALPHPDSWFTERGSPAPGVTNTSNDMDSDEDIVVDRANISTRCPLTFLPFKEPYSSKKCPHSYEKNAVLDLIRKSTSRIGSAPGRRGPGDKAIQCPVTGCDQVLTAADLHEDIILIRKLKRKQQAREQGAEDSEPEDESSPRRRQVDGVSSDVEEQFSQARQRVASTKENPRRPNIIKQGDPSDED